MAGADCEVVFGLLSGLTEVLSRWSYEGTARAGSIVARVADRYGVSATVVFLADGAVLTVEGRTVACSAVPEVPPLHRVSELKRLLAAIDGGALPAAAAADRLAALRRAAPPFWDGWRVPGVALFSAGFGVSVQSTWQEVAASAGCGAAVGVLILASATRPRLALLAPLLASVGVSTAVLFAVQHGLLTGGPIQLLVPALFYFIPGDALAAAMLELAAGRVTAGAARLVSSATALLMLGFGALIATVLAGVPAAALFDTGVPADLGLVAACAGWVAFAVGVMLTFAMAPADFPWALALILATAGLTALASAALGDPLGTFAGAAAMTALALTLGRRPTLPPAYVLYLGAFYVLTPGSHGLRGIESWIGGHRVQGAASVADMVSLLTALAVGMLLGAVTATQADRFSRAR